jgi:hypothetical protein
MAANDRQVGGDHYKQGGEEHWDRAWRLKYDPFQYIITKWVERWRDKGGIEDLKKAQHAIEKYIELVSKDAPAPDSPHDAFNSLLYGGVKENGWIQFTFEGGRAGSNFYTCKECREYFSVPLNHSPAAHHKCPGKPQT